MTGREYQDDVDRLLALQNANGAEYWSASNGSISKGGPFSTIEVCTVLTELGYSSTSKELIGVADLIFRACREDGRIRTSASGAIYPCQTASAARALCQLGYASDPRLRPTFEHLLGTQHSDGGWRCNASKFGSGPETKASNPGPTLTALDVFRYTPHLNTDERLDRAVAFLLNHWDTREPLGPCHFGIGSLFMQVEYPLFRYNLFNFVYTLSFYSRARSDKRFIAAAGTLKSKLIDGMMVVENPNSKLKDYAICRRGQKSQAATKRYHEILVNLATQ